uniref:Cytochrome p450 n=1 Tax=Croton stellatopilosus TaxID=431156 RepID=A0A3G2CJW1_9ROSI|nr:cytochrome p450 [Croton stellatopilosus]
MALFFFFLILVLPIFLFSLLSKHRTSKSNLLLHLPPGPKGLPLIGNLHQLDYSALHSCLWQLAQKYGPLMSLRLGSKQVLVVSSAKLAEEIMKTHDLLFCSRPALLANQKLNYNCLNISFAPYNNHWREMRKICIVHLFNSNRVHSFQPIREFEVSQMIHNISETALASKPVNLSEAMTFLTSTIICRVALGKKYEEEEVRRFHEMFKEIQAVFAGFYVSDYFPSLGFIDKFNPLTHRLEKIFKVLDSFYEEILQEHLDPNRLKPEQEDILDVLIQILKDSSSKSKAHLTFDHIKAVLMDVFLAGTETSAGTVIWAMSYLMKNPSAMQKAQEEVRRTVGEKGFANEEDTQKLEYMKAVIKETLRLQPVVPLLLPRESSQNCRLEGYDIPCKTVVYVNAWAIGKDPQVWENPEEFCPERFMANSIDLKGNDFGLIPFGAGRRICPGIYMGLSTVELSLANLLYKFDWEMPDEMKGQDLDMEVQPGITVHRRNALCLMPTNTSDL